MTTTSPPSQARQPVLPRVLFTCGREPSYTRNQIVRRALASSHVVDEVVEERRGYFARYSRLLWRLAVHRQPFDIAFVGFHGYLLVIWLRLLAGLRVVPRRPIVFDAYVSNWDTLCFDRARFRPYSLVGFVAYCLDWVACHLADMVILDTNAHAKFFGRAFHLDERKLAVVPVGCDLDLFRSSADSLSQPTDGRFRVFFYGSYLPLHGVEHIVRAAKLLEAEGDFELEIVGDGVGRSSIEELAASIGCRSVRFVDWLPYVELPAAIAWADVCLGGHFGASAKARRTVATKAYQFAAMGRATIVTAGSGNREVFTHGQTAYFCEPASPRSLADAVIALRADAGLRARIACRGRELIVHSFGQASVASELERIVSRALSEGDSAAARRKWRIGWLDPLILGRKIRQTRS